MAEPTQRQRAVLGAIRRHFDNEGVAPTLREIALALRIDPKSVAQHLDRLERKGYIRRRPRESRNIRLTDLCEFVFGDGPAFGSDRILEGAGSFAASGALPLVGQIAAGQPVLAEENLEGHVHLEGLFGPEGEVFLLRVQGDSMIDAGIRDGDLVAVRSHAGVRNGEIAAVVVDGEATIKRLYREGHMLRLEPENSAYPPLVVDTRREEARIVGPVAGVIRKVM